MSRLEASKAGSRSPPASGFSPAARPRSRRKHRPAAQGVKAGAPAFPGGRAGQQAARRARHRGRRVPRRRAGPAAVREGKPASSGPGPPRLPRSPDTQGGRLLPRSRGAELGEHRRGGARTVPRGARRGRWQRRAAPPHPTPPAAASPRGHRPRAAAPARGRREMRRRRRSPLLRPDDLRDKSLQHAAGLQCESHPPRRLLQHQRLQTNK